MIKRSFIAVTIAMQNISSYIKVKKRRKKKQTWEGSYIKVKKNKQMEKKPSINKHT